MDQGRGSSSSSRVLILQDGWYNSSAAAATEFWVSERSIFVAALRACTRNKGLVRGTSLHNDLVQRGLLEKCSHALVIMYTKCGGLGKEKGLLDMHKGCDVRMGCINSRLCMRGAWAKCFGLFWTNAVWGHPSRCSDLCVHIGSMCNNPGY